MPPTAACVNTTKQALDICDRLDPQRTGALGVALDVYHIWWDPELMAQIARAGRDRLLAFHVCDWLVPTKDILNDRGMMGDGVIDIKSIRAAVEAQGFAGYSEIEIFSDDWWANRSMRCCAPASSGTGRWCEPVGWAKRSVPTICNVCWDGGHGAKSAFAHPTASPRTARSRKPRKRTRPPRTGAPLSA